MSTETPLLRLENLAMHFKTAGDGFLARGGKRVKAVDGVDLTVHAGETVGLVGESGCGKSTTARLITRLLEPTNGKVLFEGTDIAHVNERGMRPYRRDIQLIFQDPYSSLNPRHTVGTIVGTALRVHDLVPRNGVPRRVQELLEMVGLNPEHDNRYPHEFSGGQRQRIGIARALATRPKIIVADEPVSALDVSIRAQVMNLLENLRAELGIAFVFIAHDLGVVRHFCDRVAVMYLGKVIEEAPRDLLYEQAAAPVHAGAAVGRAGHRGGPRRAAEEPHPAHRRRAQPGRPAVRLPVPHAVLEGRGHLRRGRAAAAPGGARPVRGVPFRGGAGESMSPRLRSEPCPRSIRRDRVPPGTGC